MNIAFKITIFVMIGLGLAAGLMIDKIIVVNYFGFLLIAYLIHTKQEEK